MKKVRGIGIVLGMIMITLNFIGCQKDNSSSDQASDQSRRNVSPTGITVKTATGNGIYTAGGKVTIDVTVLPSRAKQNYKLSILSGSGYATLSNNVLTAVKNGVTILKAVTQNGEYSDTCAVTIANQTATVATVAPSDTVKGDYYVSPSGNDNNPGTFALPFKSIEKAYAMAAPGKVIYFRGGDYKPLNPGLDIPLYLANGINGTASAMISFLAYPGETPVIDLSSLNHTGETVWGVQFTGNYWHWKGFEVTGFPPISWKYVHMAFVALNCNNCIFENMVIHDNDAMGFDLSHNSNNNLILNCDAYNNTDPETTIDPDGNADGFHFEYLAAGTTNTIQGCRAWYNSDDGIDCYGSDGNIIYNNCWSFYNGYAINTFTPSGGDGDGFKLGYTVGSYTTILRTLTNCLAVKNHEMGYDQNSGVMAVSMTNCINYYSGDHGIYLYKYNEANYLKNCISLYAGSGYNALITSQSTVINCSWQGVTLTDASFASTDQSQLLLPRNSDGSLPSIQFLQLSASSAYQW